MVKMTDAKLAAIGRWGVLLPPALAIGLAGVAKFTDPTTWKEMFPSFGLPVSLVPVVGVWEIVAAVLMFPQKTRFYGAVLAVLAMVGAGGARGVSGEYALMLPPIVLASLAGITAWWARPEYVDRWLAKEEPVEAPSASRRRPKP